MKQGREVDWTTSCLVNQGKGLMFYSERGEKSMVCIFKR